MSVLSHYDQGCKAFDQGNFSQAVFHLEKARETSPTDAVILTRLGNALKHIGQFEKAVEIHESLVEMHGAPEAISNLATTYLAWGHTREAVIQFTHALKLRPDDPQLLFNLATALQWSSDFEQAVTFFEKAISLAPDHYRAHTNLGICLKTLGRFEAARNAQKRACEIAPDDPDTNWNLALTELLMGHFESGFKRYEFRRKMKGFTTIGGTWWDGEQSTESIVVYAEQGLGDTIQFIRYLPLLRAKTPNVIFMCRAAMAPFLEQCLTFDVDVAPLAPVAPSQKVAPLLSLPFLLRHTTPYSDNIPYFKPDENIADDWESILDTDNRPKIGLCWQGNPGHRDDVNRSIPLEQLTPLLHNREVRFFSLQKHHGLAQLETLPNRFKVIDLGAVMDEQVPFIDTAAVISKLDVVITVDTAIAHLSGALGCETWTLLPFVPDFRWGLAQRCPYYPRMRLFRQARRGDWTSVVDNIRDALLERALPSTFW